MHPSTIHTPHASTRLQNAKVVKSLRKTFASSIGEASEAARTITENTMSLSETLLPEFDAEMASTRRTLERIPEDQLTWKPHEKSMLLGRLAGHLAELPGFGLTALTTDKFDFSAARPADFKPLVAQSQKHVLEIFDKKVAETRAAIVTTSDEEWNKNWTLSMGERKIFSGTRQTAIRRMMMNHIIHHRAQLGVYLRLTGAPVPSIYGPSADEGK
jgi:uncharacterized damage-inducible protein DinB